MKKYTANLIPLALAALFVCAFVPAANAQSETSFDEAAETAKRDLDAAMRELSELRERIAEEKLPLSRELTQLETELADLRRKFENSSRELDTKNLDLNTLRNEVKARRDEKSYLSSLLDEYVRNFESRIHITELQRYRDVLDEARLAPENSDLSPAEIFDGQTDLLEASIDRLLDLSGGTTFEGRAVAENGTVKDVTFALVGPIGLFSAKDGSVAGLAEQRIGSLEPNMVLMDDPVLNEAAAEFVAQGEGPMPLDPTLGNAQKVEEVQDNLWEHIKKGGVVMVPILLMASASLLVALGKWIHISRVPQPSPRKVEKLLDTVSARDFAGANDLAKSMSGPTGEMIRAGLEHVRETKDLVEEVMFEKMLETRLKLQSFLPFVAICAAAAPLMGLLGTVTGIINTFKMITVFGTGDAKTLSGGISEALITTEFGLIIAIPSLLLHAFLARKARRHVDGMEKTAVKFVNRLAARGESPEQAAS